MQSVGGSDETGSPGPVDAALEHHPLSAPPLTRPRGGDSGRRAVWLGRHTPEKISGVPKARLRRVRNPP